MLSLSAGDITAELNRRLGMARADFIALERVWKHSSLHRTRRFKYLKPALFRDCCTACSTQFNSPCVRQSNTQSSSSESGQKAVLSKTLLCRQLLLVKRVADLPSGDFMRTCVSKDGSFDLVQLWGSRPRGRPRMCWATEVCQFVHIMAEDPSHVEKICKLPHPSCKQRVKMFCFGA